MSHGTRGKRKVDPLVSAYTCPTCERVDWHGLGAEVIKDLTMEEAEAFITNVEEHPDDAKIYTKNPMNALRKWQRTREKND